MTNQLNSIIPFYVRYIVTSLVIIRWLGKKKTFKELIILYVCILIKAAMQKQMESAGGIVEGD